MCDVKKMDDLIEEMLKQCEHMDWQDSQSWLKTIAETGRETCSERLMWKKMGDK